MRDRDELLKVLLDADEAHEPEGAMWPELADAILAAGYRKPRTITTVEELDALSERSVIRTSGVEDECAPRVAIKSGFWNSESEWFTADDSEWCLSSDELDDLPATVLFEPDPTA